jgi:putative endonuclease
MIYYSYVIYNREHNRFYYGFCADLEKTEAAHNLGQVDLTKDYPGWSMLFHEEFTSKQVAIRRSRFYRTVGGQRFLKNILNF